MKSFPIKTKNIFRSFASRDVLYRSTTSKNRFQLEIINIATGEIIQKKELQRDTTLKKSFVYIRNGKTHRINKQESLHDMMKTSGAYEPSIIALPSTDTCKTTLIWSTFYADESLVGGGVGIGVNPLIGILTMVGVNAIRGLKMPTTISRYFYLSTNCQHEFDNENAVKSKQEMIDEYEITLDKKRIFYKSKGYFNFKNSIIGLYFNERQPKITLVKF